MKTRTEQLQKLLSVVEAIYVARKDSHPKVAAQFHVDLFVSRNRNDKYFDDLLQMEIEDCSRTLA